MGILDQGVSQTPFLIAVFHGFSKPKDISEYFSDFVLEMKEVESTGIFFNLVKFDVIISAILADAPARSFIKQCVQYNSSF